MRALFVVLLLGGCDRVFLGDPPVVVDAPSDTTTALDIAPPQPTGCGYVGTPEADNDGDSVANMDDECPNVAQTQSELHNEDNDCAGDACDLCPHLPNDDEGDADGDGIGDSCDLRPGVPTNTQRRFESFANFDELVPWGGAWQPAGAADVLANTSNSFSLMLANLEGGPAFRMDTTIQFPTAPPAGAWDVGMVFGAASVTNVNTAGYFVGIRSSAAGTKLGVYALANQQLSELAQPQNVEFEVNGAAIALRVTVEATDVIVTATIDQAPVLTTFVLPFALAPDTYYGLATRGPIRAAFRYLWHTE